ncbi:MAG: hypothetical protein ABJA57_05140 [Ginsengibacter sp.]
MKKLPLFIVSTLIVGYTMVSCSKSKDKTATQTTLQKIQAKWQVDNLIDHLHDPTFDTTITSVGTASDYVDFRTDGKVYTFFDGSADTSTYALVGDTSILITLIGNYKIQTLTDHILKLYGREDDPSTSAFFEETINLKK